MSSITVTDVSQLVDGDDLFYSDSRRFLFWTFIRAHYLMRNIRIDPGQSIITTEPMIEVLHPWWERGAFYMAGWWSKSWRRDCLRVSR